MIPQASVCQSAHSLSPRCDWSLRSRRLPWSGGRGCQAIRVGMGHLLLVKHHGRFARIEGGRGPSLPPDGSVTGSSWEPLVKALALQPAGLRLRSSGHN